MSAAEEWRRAHEAAGNTAGGWQIFTDDEEPPEDNGFAVIKCGAPIDPERLMRILGRNPLT